MRPENCCRQRAGAPQVASRNCSGAGTCSCDRGFGWYGMVVLPSAWSYYVPLPLPAVGLIAYGLRRKRAVPATAVAAITLGAAAALLAPSTRRKALAQLRMLVFNEAVFAAAWWRVLTGSMDVKWAQERSTIPRRPSDFDR